MEWLGAAVQWAWAWMVSKEAFALYALLSAWGFWRCFGKGLEGVRQGRKSVVSFHTWLMCVFLVSTLGFGWLTDMASLWNLFWHSVITMTMLLIVIIIGCLNVLAS